MLNPVEQLGATATKQGKLCTICAEAAVMSDQVGLAWCEEHRFRGDFLNWGAAHGWPEMSCETYAIAQGKYFWYIAAALGVDDMIWLMLVVIEQREKEGVTRCKEQCSLVETQVRSILRSAVTRETRTLHADH